MKFNLKSWSLGILHPFTLTLVLAGAFIGSVLAAPDNQGKEFVLGFMENYDGGGTISFYLTGPTATRVTVQGGGFGPKTFPVVPEEITSVTLPISLRASGSGTIENKGLLLSARDEFVVYGLNQKEFTTDAYLGLPTDVAGTEYIVPSFSNAKKTLPSELQIIAHQDGTEITFTPKKATVKGVDVKSIRAKKSAHFTLNRLESIQFKAKGGRLGDLTGSVIISSKPVSVFGGHQCGIVPNRALACDHLVEQIPPVNTWGNSFLTTPSASRTGGDIFRILAANDGTAVEIDGETVAELKKGQFEQVDLASGTFHHITTSGPALVVQYAKGTSVDDVVSDPFMIVIPPTEQFGSSYLVSTPLEAPVAFDNYLNIVAPTDKLTGLRLDDRSIAVPFTAIGNTGYSGAQVPVAIGAHTLRHLSSNVPIGVYAYGFANSDSYGYPGGSRLAKIAEPCTPTETVQGDGLDNDCDRKIDEELLNELDDDGDGRIDEDLAPVEPPVANAGGPYTVNEGSSVTLNGTAASDPNGDQLTFAWDLDNNGSFETSGAAPTFTGADGPSVHTVTLRVTGSAGSSWASTTVTVNNVAPRIEDFTPANLACFSETNPLSLTIVFSDPAQLNDTLSATIDWGDGEPGEVLTSGQPIEHDYGYISEDDVSRFTVTVTASDEDGGVSSLSKEASVEGGVCID